MSDKSQYHITVEVQTTYIEGQSIPEQDRYVFAYTITIHNDGNVTAKLLSRHWVITDSNGKVQEVHGEGVVGEYTRSASPSADPEDAVFPLG